MTSNAKGREWSPTADAAERRKLQNRLAQRNYRKKRKMQKLKEREQSVTAENLPPCVPSPPLLTTHFYDNDLKNSSEYLPGIYSDSSSPYPFPIPDDMFTNLAKFSDFSPDNIFTQLPEQCIQPQAYGQTVPLYSQSAPTFFDVWPSMHMPEVNTFTNILPNEDERAEASGDDSCIEVYMPKDLAQVPRSGIYDRGGDSPQSITSGGHTALQAAVRSGHERISSMLLEKGADVAHVGGDGQTMLHIAATQDCTNIVQILLSRGLNVNARDYSGKTPLHLAVEHGHIATVRFLLEQHSFIDATDNDRSTALHVAAHHGFQPITLLLIENGANVNAKDGSGRTALHWATEAGHEAVVRFLLNSRGVDIEATVDDV